MSTKRPIKDDMQSRLARTEAVLDAIEAAIESDLDVDVVTELPEGLRDPIKAMERGRELLDNGLIFSSIDLPDAYERELRIAARNGGIIPEHVRLRMHAERAEAEAQMAIEFDEQR